MAIIVVLSPNSRQKIWTWGEEIFEFSYYTLENLQGDGKGVGYPNQRKFFSVNSRYDQAVARNTQ